jgi:hypothetical protein
MSTFVCEQSVGQALHQQPTMGGAEGFIHAMKSEEVGVRWPMPFGHK